MRRRFAPQTQIIGQLVESTFDCSRVAFADATHLSCFEQLLMTVCVLGRGLGLVRMNTSRYPYSGLIEFFQLIKEL